MPGDYIMPGGKTILDRDLVLSPAIVGANTTAEQIFSCPGARAGDIVTISKPTAQAGIGIVGARVSSADNVGITFGNWTGGGITPTAAETYLVRLGRG